VNWLVLIAINEYPRAPRLTSPLNDVAEIKRVLLERYRFDAAHTITLLNEQATLDGIYELFGSLRDKVQPQDSVLLYYAGHGHLDKLTNSGAWIPYDGGLGFNDRWLPDNSISGVMLSVKAKHFLIIADSCFSGNLLAASRRLQQPQAGPERYQEKYEFQSRIVLTSGSNEPVPDTGVGRYSGFAYHLFNTLEQNTQPYLDVEEIYVRILRGVTTQQPQIGGLRNAGHQGGSYVFFLKDAPDLARWTPAYAEAVPGDGGAAGRPVQPSGSNGAVAPPTPSEEAVMALLGDLLRAARSGGDAQHLARL